MHNKLIAGIVVVFLGIMSIWYVASRSQATQAETTHVRIANLPVVHGLPLYVAIEKGYFKDTGIDVEVVKFEAPNQIIDAIMVGQVDITSPSGALGITGIANFKNPGKLEVYAVSGGTSGNSGVSFVVPIDSRLGSLGDLRGKKLGILAGTIQWRTITREILEKNGLDMDKDVAIVELAPSLQVQALAAGQVDALLALEPIPTIVVNKKVGKVWIPDPTVRYVSDPSWLGAGVVNVDFARKNPKVTKNVIAIIEKAMLEIENNPDAYRQYLKGYTPLTDDSISKIPIVSFKTCDQLITQDKDAIQKFFDIFTKHGVVVGKIDVDDVLYCDN
jgi:NitT/TauT family transport system substrate-binding protein